MSRFTLLNNKEYNVKNILKVIQVILINLELLLVH